MKFEEIYPRLRDLSIFNKSNLRLLENDERVLDSNIKYWIKTGKIIPLKKGWYVFALQYGAARDKDTYREFIANKLIEPSYCSAEYILNRYGALTESVSAITSMTTKSGREIKNALGVFRYYSISDSLFEGYTFKTKNIRMVVIEAELAKALFDFLYMRFIRNRPVNTLELEQLRINWEKIPASHFKKSMAYAGRSRSRKLAVLYTTIKNRYYAH